MLRLATRTLAFGAITTTQKILGFALVAQAAALLGPVQFGKYTYLLNLANFGATLILLGFPQLLTREISVHQASGRADLLAGVQWFAWRTIAGGITLVVILAFIFGHSSYAAGTSQIDIWITIAVFATVALTGIQQGILRGLGRTLSSAWPMMLLQTALLLGALTIAEFQGWAASAIDLLCWFVLAGLVAGACMAAMIWKMLKKSPGYHVQPRYTFPLWIKSLIPFSLISCFTMLLYRADVVIMGIFLTPAETGRYFVASQLAMIINMPVAIVGMISEPWLAAAFKKDEIHQVQNYVSNSALISGTAALIGLIFYAFLGKTLLLTFFGKEFIKSYDILLILSFGFFVHAAFGPIDSLLNMVGKEKVNMLILAACAVICVALNFVLIPIYGAMGAAISTLVSLISYKVFLLYSAYRYFAFGRS